MLIVFSPHFSNQEKKAKESTALTVKNGIQSQAVAGRPERRRPGWPNFEFVKKDGRLSLSLVRTEGLQ